MSLPSKERKVEKSISSGKFVPIWDIYGKYHSSMWQSDFDMIKTVINPRKLEIEWNKGSQDQPGRKLITSHRDQQSKKKIVKVKVGYCKKNDNTSE